MLHKDEPDHKRLFLAVGLAAMLLIGWQAQVEWPRRQQLAQYHGQQAKKAQQAQQKRIEAAKSPTAEAEENPLLTRPQRLATTARVRIHSDKLKGSIALKGARFDDIALAKYRETLDPTSPEVILFSPNGDANAYFAQTGWVSEGGKTRVPDHQSIWQADKKTLSPGETVHLTWNNGEGVTFILAVTLDQDYMFSVAQRVENRSGHTISVLPYGYINRSYVENSMHYAILHEGPLGVLHQALEEVAYSDLRDNGAKVFENASGWFGITDKYWLSALIPTGGTYKSTFSHYVKDGQNRYQVDYLGTPLDIAEGGSATYNVRLFAGAKELKVLDRYATGDAGNNEPPIPLFDRAVDFGVLYFLTKPMFLMLEFFNSHVGNFGIAILLLTIVIRLVLYPLANKAYKATAQMRALQPEMLKIRERYAGDQMTLQKETMALYKREKVNPAAGCLPVLIQMPVFFALYKMLFVTIEMRQAPFFGWIEDLSMPDPSNLFTAFGLLPWSTPTWMHLGVLPILYCITMVIQMKQQPKPTDPVQAKMLTYMPYFFLFVFASMPAGLVLYWTWSNVISIIQQHYISKRHGTLHSHQPAKAA